jgi:hypothetical protein
MNRLKIIVPLIGLIIGVILLVTTISNMLSSSERFSTEKQMLLERKAELEKELNAANEQIMIDCENAKTPEKLIACRTAMQELKSSCMEFKLENAICDTPRFANFVATLDQRINTAIQTKLEAELTQMQQSLELCLNARTVDEVNTCKEMSHKIKEMCETYPNLTICTDQRLEKIKDLQPSL